MSDTVSSLLCHEELILLVFILLTVGVKQPIRLRLDLAFVSLSTPLTGITIETPTPTLTEAT